MPDISKENSQFKFTAKRLETLKAPPFVSQNGRQTVQQRYYWQGDGLGLCVSSTGERSWVFDYRLLDRGQRRRRRDTLGEYTATETNHPERLTLRQANAMAETYRAYLKQGKDPRQIRREQEQEQRAADANTFFASAERFLKFYRPKKRPSLKPRTLEEYRRHLLVDFKMLHDQPLASITKRDVNRALDTIQLRMEGVGVNRCLATIRKLCNWAMERGEIELPPTAGIAPRAPELARKRHLFGNEDHKRPCEIPLLWHAAEAIGTAGAFVKILLLTGQRRSEVANMTWDELLELEGEHPRWLLPSDRSKNWKENLIPLSPLTVAVINALPGVVGCPYVFTSDGVHPRSGYSDLKESLDAAAKKLKAQDPDRYRGQLDEPWTFHDLRRTAKTGMAACGIQGEIRDAIFNHAPVQRMDQVYVHAAYSSEKRDAMNRWAACVARAISNEAVDAVEERVVPIRRARRLPSTAPRMKSP
jgi:integrase